MSRLLLQCSSRGKKGHLGFDKIYDGQQIMVLCESIYQFELETNFPSSILIIRLQ